jgi:hypothetical protein
MPGPGLAAKDVAKEAAHALGDAASALGRLLWRLPLSAFGSDQAEAREIAALLEESLPGKGDSCAASAVPFSRLRPPWRRRAPRSFNTHDRVSCGRRPGPTHGSHGPCSHSNQVRSPQTSSAWTPPLFPSDAPPRPPSYARPRSRTGCETAYPYKQARPGE